MMANWLVIKYGKYKAIHMKNKIEILLYIIYDSYRIKHDAVVSSNRQAFWPISRD